MRCFYFKIKDHYLYYYKHEKVTKQGDTENNEKSVTFVTFLI